MLYARCDSRQMIMATSFSMPHPLEIPERVELCIALMVPAQLPLLAAFLHTPFASKLGSVLD